MRKIGSAAKKAQALVGGGAVVVCAFVLMWGGVNSEVTTSNSLAQLAESAVDIDPATPDPTDNGKLVVAAGSMRSTETYEDEYLKPSPHLVVRRRVEMYQWTETEKPPALDPVYSMNWVEGEVDFFSFKVPGGHENPLQQIRPKDFMVSQATFASFDATRLLPLIKRLDRLELTPELLKDPGLKIVDNKLIIRRNPGTIGDALGDMRVWYEVLPQGSYTVMTVQQDERSLVGADPSSTLFIQKGLLSTVDFIEGEEGESGRNFRGMLFLGAGLLFFGCLSLLAPHASKFDLSPYLKVRGIIAVVIASAGVSLVTMGIFYLLSLTN